MEYEQICREICEAGERLYARELIAAGSGNISARLDGDQIVCTPAGFGKGRLQSEQLCVVNLQGERLGGRFPASSELSLHLEIYQAREDVRGIVHAHPPHVNAYSVTGTPIPGGVLPEVDHFLGTVPTAPYALSGSSAVPQSVRPFLDSAKIVVLSHHGTVAFDTSLERALWWTEMLDSYCRTLLLARTLGAPFPPS